MRRPVAVAPLVLAGLLLVACGGGPILANPPLVYPSPPVATPAPTRPVDPIPVVLPRDDGPHDRLTEWWYYTGHLAASDGRRFGFEAVVFRAERGSVPVAWASHLALTDEQGGRFLYAQRSEVGSQVDRSPRDADGAPTGFDLQVGGLSPALVADGAPPIAAPWRLSGTGGTDRIQAALAEAEATDAGASFVLDLDLRAVKPAALHDGDGFIDFGPAGSSYYYSRTRLAATGELVLDGERLAVEGIAWFDHQWGDFISVGGGGWDWISVNLEDGTDLTLSVVLDAVGDPIVTYGTLVDRSGAVTHVGEGGVTITSLGSWTSPRTGRTYPVHWSIELPEQRLFIELTPTLADQELDTRASTGIIYWEGSQLVAATRALEPVGGEAYVEITRYGGSGE